MANPMWGASFNTAEFMRNVRAQAAQMKQDIEKESDKAATRFENHAKRNVPRDDGDLAATIRKTKVTDGYEVTIGNDQFPYGAPLEFGHTLNGTHIQGERFWTPLKKVHNKRWRAAIRRVARAAFKRFT